MKTIQDKLDLLPGPVQVIIASFCSVGATLITIITVVLLFLFSPMVLWYERRKRARIARSRVVLICEVNGRIGIISRDAYQVAAQAYWEEYLNGNKEYDHGHLLAPHGRTLEVPGVVVLKAKSSEYFTVMSSLMCEKAVFNVPNALTPMDDAYQTLLGKKWNGAFVNW